MPTWQKTLLICLVWLFVANLFAIVANNRLNLVGDNAYTWINPGSFHDQKSWNPIDLHTHWDSAFYLDIAEHGYQFLGQDQLSNIVFFPLYPFLIKTASLVLFGNFPLAGWIVSMMCLFLALLYLQKLVEKFHPEISSDLVIAFLLIFPTAFFLNAVYAESLFLLLSILAFYAAFQKKFTQASLWGLFAALTRVTGILLFLPLGIEFVRTYGREWSSYRKAWTLFLIPLGTACFFLYHKIAFGGFLLFFKVEKLWGRAFVINWSHFLLLSPPAIVNFALDAGFVLLSLTAIFFLFKKISISYGAYVAATVAVALSTGTFMSIGRYILVLFPIYIWLASIKNPYVKYGWAFVSVLLFALYTLLFVNNYWAG
jgi:Gpi18-like mannosyltransferase